MDVDLHERLVADALELVNLARLDHENVPCPGLELRAVDDVAPAPRSHELDFVVWMTVRAWTATRERVEQEHGHVHVAVVGADEMVRAPLERQIFLANTVHRRVSGELAD